MNRNKIIDKVVKKNLLCYHNTVGCAHKCAIIGKAVQIRHSPRYCKLKRHKPLLVRIAFCNRHRREGVGVIF